MAQVTTRKISPLVVPHLLDANQSTVKKVQFPIARVFVLMMIYVKEFSTRSITMDMKFAASILEEWIKENK